MNKSLTLTVLANMTSNYGDNIGNIPSVQKIFKNGKVYATRSKESLKNGIMIQSGMYDDLETEIDKKVTQKVVSEDLNVTNCRALEGGYLNTVRNTFVRKSSFYLTDAVSCDEFITEYRFHNNLYMAKNYAKKNNINLVSKSSKAGLMPYQYEYDKSLKVYSITIDLDMIGRDDNFESEEASDLEKSLRVKMLLDGVKNLSLVVKGNLDNAEPILIFGGIVKRKTHYFQNVVNIKNNKLEITEDLKDRLKDSCNVGLLSGGNLSNEGEIKEKLSPLTIKSFFDNLEKEVENYYGV